MNQNPDRFPADEAHFLLSGQAGHLELKTFCPMECNQEQIAIICHPHPLQQGSMDNKVVTTAMRAFRELGIRTVRFNYRGVGASEGSYDKERGASADLQTVIEWAQTVLPQSNIHLVGFSFGAFIAFQGALNYKEVVHSLILLGPSVQNSPYGSIIGRPECPWQIIMGTADEVVSVQAVIEWYETIEDQASLLLLPKTGHFFHGKLIILKSYIKQFIQLNYYSSMPS
jgi:uncharacterized protein